MEMTFEMINMNKMAGVRAMGLRDGSALKRTYSVVEDLASVPSPRWWLPTPCNYSSSSGLRGSAYTWYTRIHADQTVTVIK